MTTMEARYRIEGMDCPACVAKVANAVRRVPGVSDVSVSLAAEAMTVDHDGAPNIDAAIVRQLKGVGYRATAARDNVAGEGAAAGVCASLPEPRAWWRAPKAAPLAACALALVVAALAPWLAPGGARYAFGAATLVGLAPVARRALMAALAGTPFSIETLMTVAAGGAAVIGATEEAATVVLLFLVGEALEGVAARKARAGIQGLAALVPKDALVERDGRTECVAAERLAVGDVILVRPGDRVAADGEVVAGTSAVDEASVTGESVPARKAKGDAVFAGTVNADGALRVRVTAAAADNTIARVVRLVEEAQEGKAPVERFIDRFSALYTPCVVGLALLVAVAPPLLAGQPWGAWAYKGLVLLLIGCPCALVISTPAAMAAALAAGARHGLLLKGGAVLERLAGVTAMALDKTGTLTAGRPAVTDVVAQGRGERDVLSLAAALESGSSHPLALAVLAHARERGVPVPPAADAGALAGRGVVGRVGGVALFLGSPAAAEERVALDADQRAAVARLEGEGKSVAVLLAGGAVAGLVAARDEPRPDAKAGVEALRAAGVEPVMLTGDNPRAAEAVGRELGLPVHAGLLPQDKQRLVREMRARGEKVAKAGDGINDAPALAAADVGIAMGGGAGVALETADAAVLYGRLLDLARMVDLSRRAMGNVRQNVAVALGLKAAFLVTTVAGVTGLWPAVLADTGATVLVTANAMRLLAWSGGPGASARRRRVGPRLNGVAAWSKRPG